MSVAQRPGYEVTAEFVEITNVNGKRWFLGRGADLPDWVPDERVAELVKSNAVTEFGVI